VAEQPLKDIIEVMRDTGMRNARELYCMRVENVDFDAGTIFTPDSKTESGRRFIPMSSRVKQILQASCGAATRARPLLCAPRLRQLRTGEDRKSESCNERNGPR
jgi:integrase